MKRLFTLVCLLVLPFLNFTGSCKVHAETGPPSLILTEIKVRNDSAGFDEYIELTNPSLIAVSLNDYFIGYTNTPAPASDQLFTKFVLGVGLLSAGKSMLLAKNPADPGLAYAKALPFSSLSDSGGTVRVSDRNDGVLDQLSWTNIASLAVGPVQYLPNNTATKSQSFNRNMSVDGEDDVSNPHWLLGTPSPLGSELLPVPEPDPVIEPADPPVLPEPEPAQQPTESPESEVPAAEQPAVTILPPQITELLPNPAAPATDDTDEFVELFNPNQAAISLSDYRLQSGNSFNYSFTFGALTLPAQAYQVFYVSQTGAILSNTSGQARLLDPAGSVVAQTNQYDGADDGQAWALVNGAWQWTTTPTPGTENVLTSAASKTAAVKKTASPKSAATKTTKVVAAKTTKTAAEREVYQDPAESTISSLHPGILVGLGVVTLLYAAYEYRYDVRNAVYRIQRYRSLRRTARAKS